MFISLKWLNFILLLLPQAASYWETIDGLWFDRSIHRSHQETANEKTCYMMLSGQSAAVL